MNFKLIMGYNFYFFKMIFLFSKFLTQFFFFFELNDEESTALLQEW